MEGRLKERKASTADSLTTAYDINHREQHQRSMRKGLLTYYVALLNIGIEETQENTTRSLASAGQLAELNRVSLFFVTTRAQRYHRKVEMLLVLDVD